MKRLFAYTAVFFVIACSSDKIVEFQTGSLESVLKMATQTGKMVLVDIYSDNWGGCVALDREVFKNSEASVFINANLISKRIHGQKEEGKPVVERYNIRGYPTVLLLSGDGTEIDRICGFDGDREIFIKTLTDYCSGTNTLNAMLTQINNDTLNIHYNYQMAKKYIARWEGEKAVPYFQRILFYDKEDKAGYHEETNCYMGIYEARYNKNPLPLQNFMYETKNSEFMRMAYNYLNRFYKNEENTEKLIGVFDFAVENFPGDASILNDYAWYIYENKITDKYPQGIQMARKAVEMEPDAAHIWDTLSWLLYANGDKEELIKCMKKAIELQPENEYFSENLEKMTGRD